MFARTQQKAAIVRSDGTILGESLASQHSIHQEWGGVVPSLAKSAHEDNIDNVIQDALDKAGMTIQDVDAIGVTVGPGLEICLRVGCEKAKQLALKYDKPFVGVHHVSLYDFDIIMIETAFFGGYSHTMTCNHYQISWKRIF